MNDWYLWIMTAIAAAAVAAYIRAARRYRRNIGKVTFMFDAIDNIDYTFSFSVDGKHRKDALLNGALNRIKGILEHARDEATEREKYYEHIMDAAGTGLLVADGKGHILQHNTAATRLLHRTVLTHMDQIKDALHNGALSQRETYTTLRGERVRIIALNDINGELADREVDSWVKLIRVLTHEIMNTITPITSLSETLMDKATGEQREGLETINRTGRDLMAFVNNYRRFTHVPQPQPQLFYVKPLAERAARLSRHHVDVCVQPADLLMYADEALMTRVLANLLKNADEAADECTHEARIWVNAYTDDDDAVVIDVGDDAGNIEADVAQHVFVPFFTTKKEGSGIGLPLSRQIMRASGGTLMLLQDAAQGTVVFRMKI